MSRAGRGARARFSLLVLLAFNITAAVLAAAPPAARAQAPAPPARLKVTLFSTRQDDPLGGRLAAEIEALGLEVFRSTVAPAVALEEQVRQAFRVGARAAVIADGRRTELWIAEEGTDGVAIRQELEIERVPGLESVLSLRTVELLRVSLGLVSEPPAVARAAAPVTADAPLPAQRRPEEDGRFSIAVGSGVLSSSGRAGTLATISAGLRARLLGPVGLEVAGYAPLGSDTISDADGRVETSVWLAGGGVLLAPRRAARWAVEAGAGLLAVIVRGTGLANDPATGATDQAVGVAFYGRGAARVRLSHRWSLRLDVTGGSTRILRPVISVGSKTTGDRDVAAWGTVFVAGTGGVEARF